MLLSFDSLVSITPLSSNSLVSTTLLIYDVDSPGPAATSGSCSSSPLSAGGSGGHHCHIGIQEVGDLHE
jgi:hypothetical protein